MKIGEFLIACLVFVFSIFIFPTFNEAVSTYTGDLSILVHAFPILFIVISAVFPIFLLIDGGKN
jgi:hypothetical protein